MRFKVIALVAFMATLDQSSADADDTQGGLTWRLENSFRFFKQAEHTEELLVKFEKLRAKLNRSPTIREFEKDLAASSDGWARWMRL